MIRDYVANQSKDNNEKPSRHNLKGFLIVAEGLVCAIRYSSFLFQTAPGGVIAEPQEIAVLIGHLARYADLVEVEIGEVVAALAHFAVGVVTVVVLAHQFLTIEGDGSEAVRRHRERRFSRVHPYTI